MPPGKSPTRRYTLRWQRCLLVSGAVTLVLGLNIVLMNEHLELHDEEELDEYQWQHARKLSSPLQVAAAHGGRTAPAMQQQQQQQGAGGSPTYLPPARRTLPLGASPIYGHIS